MKLRPYQEAGRDFLASRRLALLADEMRVGKTPQAILAAHKIGARRVLVLCPAVAVPHWEREFPKWWPDGELPERMIRSYESARKYRAALRTERWDLLIVDEAHYAKNPNAQRTKMIFAQGGIAWQAERVWCLTGTPAPRHAGELWPILRAFGVYAQDYRTFLLRYCTFGQDFKGRPIPNGTREDRIPELRALLGQIMLRRTRAQVAPEIPPIAFELLPVRPVVALDDKRFADAPADDDELAAWIEERAGSLAEWRQLVAFAKVAPLGAEIITSLDARLYAQTIVFGHHVAPMTELCNLLRRDGVRAELLTGATTRVNREAIQERFAKGETQVLVANIVAAGTAIDLSAADHAYMLEMSWTPGDNCQAVNRIVSLEKTRPTSVDVVTWANSFDDRIQSVLTRRVRQLNALF